MSLSDNIPRKLAARVIGVSVSTLIRLTKSNGFPKPFMIGGRVFYSEKEVLQWNEANKQNRLGCQDVN